MEHFKQVDWNQGRESQKYNFYNLVPIKRTRFYLIAFENRLSCLIIHGIQLLLIDWFVFMAIEINQTWSLARVNNCLTIRGTTPSARAVNAGDPLRQRTPVRYVIARKQLAHEPGIIPARLSVTRGTLQGYTDLNLLFYSTSMTNENSRSQHIFILYTETSTKSLYFVLHYLNL